TNTSQIASAVVDLSTVAAAAYVDENDANLLGAVKRYFQQDMLGSLFPPGTMEKIVNKAKIEISSTPTEEQ
ncbi:MAG: hypothetical protein IJ193_00660, partial [Bacilli bacterium]|nr:hypothetical protein [Bacilli bacterium]